MVKIKRVSAENIFELVSDILEKDGSVKITVTGSSMFPFLRGERDSVELIYSTFESLRRSMIVLAKDNEGHYLLHRIVKKTKDCIYLMGDAQRRAEGPFCPEQVVASVSVIWREDKKIPVENMLWILLSKVWLWLIPFRPIIIKIFGKLRSFMHTLGIK